MLEQRADDESGPEAGGDHRQARDGRLERALAKAVVALLALGVIAAESMGASPDGTVVVVHTARAAPTLSAPAGAAASTVGTATVDQPPGASAAVWAASDPVTDLDGGDFGDDAGASEGATDAGATESAALQLAGASPAGPTAAWPVDGPMTGWFGELRGQRRHGGVDIFARTGAPVGAVAAGTVVLAGSGVAGYGGYGTIVLVDHGQGVTSLYAHLSAVRVAPGQPVATGEQVGAVGTTGSVTAPHLHLEIRVGGATVDPNQWLSQLGAGDRPRHRA